MSGSSAAKFQIDHPSGRPKFSLFVQIARLSLFAVCFSTFLVSIAITQVVGVPLYWFDRDLFYRYMAFTKQCFAVLLALVTQIWGHAFLRISGDASVSPQIHMGADGQVEFDFPERLVLIANHQIYTDWIYLWFAAYANRHPTHGRFYIILKESLRLVPILGVGMMFFGFIFMSRKMAIDEPRLAHRLTRLSTKHLTRSRQTYLDPMWLLLFPEGTNHCANSITKSLQWAQKKGRSNPAHVLLPRSTGTFFCLNQLKGTVEYVYDCTMAYEGIPRGRYGDEFFSLYGIFFQGQRPKSVNMYWRRYRLAEIPLDNLEVFDNWLTDVWYEKDKLMETYLTNGRFPSNGDGTNDYAETKVKVRSILELMGAFVVPGALIYLYQGLQSVSARMLVSVLGSR